MDIGPLEYVVIGVPTHKLSHAIISEINLLQRNDKVRVVAILFVTKAADGSTTKEDVEELRGQDPAIYGGIPDDLMWLLMAHNIEQLAKQMPRNSSALVVLFEHIWVQRLRDVVQKAGGVMFSGGLVPHEVLAMINAEQASLKEALYA